MDFVGNVEKRQQRWKSPCHDWEALLRAVSALLLLCDRFGRSDPTTVLIPHCHHSPMLNHKTDTTLMLLAAPSKTGKLHSVVLHAICCDSFLHELTDMLSI
jgi:hypothetical protein